MSQSYYANMPEERQNRLRPNVKSTQSKSKPRYQKPKQQQGSSDIFSEGFATTIGDIAKVVGELASAVMLFGLIVSASFLDVFLGAFGLEIIFGYDIPFGDGFIRTVWFAGAISLFTSGAQVLLMVYWSSQKRKLTSWNWLLMLVFIVLDTAVDMTTPGYLMYGETALTMTVLGKPAMYYVVTILVGIACAFSENVIVLLGGLGRGAGLFANRR